MFEKARIKLTAWYLAIIMIVSLSFSLVIYQGVTFEFRSRLDSIERRLSDQAPRGWGMQGPVHEMFLDDFAQTRNRVILMLVYTNSVIFISSAIGGFILAGITLDPIKNAMEDQKRFIADASHELKTPLTALQTSIEVTLRDKKLRLNEAKKVLSESLEDIENMKNLSNTLLTLADYQQQGEKIEKSSLYLGLLIKKVAKKIKPLAVDKKLSLNVKTQKVKCQVNEDSIEKLLLVLLDNAIKYTPQKGKISLILEKEKKQAVIRIKDSGVGINKKDIKQIFNRFYRTDSSRTKVKTDGFGLGLSIAKRIVDLHKGCILVKSKPGKGSTFTVKLPLS